MIDSIEGPGAALRNALWHHEDTPGHVKVLYTDPTERGWEDYTPYKWQLIHRPDIGLIHVKIFNGEEMIIDSGKTTFHQRTSLRTILGPIYDNTLSGGRLGVLDFSQENVIWSNLDYRCNDTFLIDSPIA